MTKTLEEWIVIAEQLAKNNNGELPCSAWLRKNSYSGLEQCMRKNLKSFSHLKKENKFNKLEDWIVIAEQLAKDNDGFLPCSSWINENGYSGLDYCIRNNKESFSHLKQESRLKTVEEWIVIAEKIAHNNGGLLPCSSWLRKNGYSGLDQCVKNNPDKFIQQESKQGRSLENWITIAEKAAKDNGGTLPAFVDMIKNGYSGLNQCMRKYPDKFSHIVKDNKTKTVQEWVIIAEKVAKENNEILPCSYWLKSHGYTGLYSCILNNPNEFVHIQQDKKIGKSVEEWVVIAEQLARDNNDILPCNSKLRNSDNSGLNNCMTKHPDRFAHISKDNQYKSVEEWIAVAEQLAKDNNGILPKVSFVRNSEYAGLDQCMRKHSDRFVHIKQESKYKSVEEWIAVAEQLTKDNGALPCIYWLRTHGYSGLDACIRNFPDKFSSIQQINHKGKTVEQWVAVAEQLAKDNYGILPCSSKLRKDHSGLDQCISKFSDKFAHIKKLNKYKSKKEWIVIAEQLAKENNGMLPSALWIKENGYSGLNNCIRTYPNKFNHIKRS